MILKVEYTVHILRSVNCKLLLKSFIDSDGVDQIGVLVNAP